jgi:hypothetical protein
MTTTFVGVQVAQGFDYARYRPVDLDELLERKWPTGGADLYRAVPMKITVNLAAYGEACPIGFLKKTMQMMGSIWDDAVPITRCVNVRTAKNKVVPLFIQDQVAEFLPKEVPIGSAVTLYVVHMFTSPDQVGLLVNEFSAADAGKE